MTTSAGNGPLPLGVFGVERMPCTVSSPLLIRDGLAVGGEGGSGGECKSQCKDNNQESVRMVVLHYRAADIPGEAAAKLQMKFHVQCACDWIRAVRGDLLETDFVVHRNRIFHHRFHGVEAHALVADLATLCDDLLRECAA
jgi:hypothetical protein